jgi:hypothetical protein
MNGPADGLGSNLLNDPKMQLAISLMGAAGPSRMPVGLGQALAQGMQTAQQASAQNAERQWQQMRVALALRRLQAQTPATQQSATQE